MKGFQASSSVSYVAVPNWTGLFWCVKDLRTRPLNFTAARRSARDDDFPACLKSSFQYPHHQDRATGFQLSQVRRALL